MAAATDGLQKTLGAVQQNLHGSEARQAFDRLHQRTTSLMDTGKTMRSYIDGLKADESKPKDYRDSMAARLHRETAVRVEQEYHAIMKEDLPKLEAALTDASLPMPVPDANTRMLHRQELGNLLTGQTGAALTQRMLTLVGRNRDWDAELVGSHGQTLMEANGVGKDWPAFRSAAAAKLMSNPVGTERQLQSRKALGALKQMPGAVTSALQIGRFHLGDRP